MSFENVPSELKYVVRCVLRAFNGSDGRELARCIQDMEYYCDFMGWPAIPTIVYEQFSTYDDNNNEGTFGPFPSPLSTTEDSSSGSDLSEDE